MSDAIISGPSQAEGIARFAFRAKYEDLTAERRERLKISILDSLACAINALEAQPIAACLAQAKEFGGQNGRCTLIGGGKAAVEICGQTGFQLLVARTTPISQWKGLSSSQVAFGCVNAVFLASRGLTGPKYVIEGSCGLAQALDRSVDIDWEHAKLDCFDRLSLKAYNSAVPTESAIFCILELHKTHPFDPAEVVSIEADVVQDTYDFTGGGRFGPKTNVHTKEDADHSLPYLLAVALFDGDVQPAQLNPERIDKPDVQNLLLKVTVRPDKNFTARYPAEFPSRVTVGLKSGQSFSHEVSNYPGFPTRPFSWQDIDAKFDKLVVGHVGAQVSQDIKNAVHSLEDLQVSDLTKLLGAI